MANLKQIGLAFNLYNDDNGDLYPQHWGVGQWVWPDSSTSTQWNGFLAVYLGWNGDTRVNGFRYSPVFRCPLYQSLIDVTYESTAANAENVSYGYNYYWFSSNPGLVGGWPDGNPIRRANVLNPSQKILVADSGTGLNVIHCWVSQGMPMSARHGGGANFLYVDGHVDRQIPTNVGYGQPNPDYLVNWDPRY